MPIPRPSGPPSPELVKAVAFFREIGFFSAFGAKSDEECAEKLLLAHRSEWDVDLVSGDSYEDAVLLSYDGKRSWFEDTECDVCQENHVYQDVLADWAHVSRGAFRPTLVEEKWAGECGPIEVSFTQDGQRRTLTPKWNQDYLDLEILTGINEIIRPSGMEFCCLGIDQTALVVVLTPEERARIARERGWSFDR